MTQRRQTGEKRPPDREPVLRQAWLDVIEQFDGKELVIGGKSLGGRIASLIADEAGVARGTLAAPGRTGANDRITVGAIGVGGRGSLLLEQLPESAQLVALSDCNTPRAEAFKAKAQGDWPVYRDYRRLLDRQDIDAVIVATGEFQRVLRCIHACQGGKDIYAEKPLTLYVSEGRALVSVTRKHNRICQVGSQQRSMG